MGRICWLLLGCNGGESVMALCEFHDLDDIGGEGWTRGWLEVGVVSMHNMNGLRWGMHVHGTKDHVHCSNHSGLVLSCDREFYVPALVSV